MTTSKNLSLWDNVGKTDPRYVKQGSGKGYSYSAIAPYYQIKLATEQFGPYGSTWGLFDTKYIFIPDTDMCLLECTFRYPDGAFPISNVIKYKGIGKDSKQDDDFAKKIETDTITKSLSRLGFNSDVFMGQFDDSRYVSDLWQEVERAKIYEDNAETIQLIKDGLNAGPTSPLWIESSTKWATLSEELIKAIWVAPTKGGPLTTDERKTAKSMEWSNAVYDSLDKDYVDTVVSQSIEYVNSGDGDSLYQIWAEMSQLERRIIKFHLPNEMTPKVEELLTENAKLLAGKQKR